MIYQENKGDSNEIAEQEIVRQYFLAPVFPIASDNRTDIFFIQRQVGRQDLTIAGFIFATGDYGKLVLYGYLGIWNHRRGQYRMGMPAFIAFYAADAELDLSTGRLNSASVCSVMNQTVFMAARTLNG